MDELIQVTDVCHYIQSPAKTGLYYVQIITILRRKMRKALGPIGSRAFRIVRFNMIRYNQAGTIPA